MNKLLIAAIIGMAFLGVRALEPTPIDLEGFPSPDPRRMDYTVDGFRPVVTGGGSGTVYTNTQSGNWTAGAVAAQTACTYHGGAVASASAGTTCWVGVPLNPITTLPR